MKPDTIEKLVSNYLTNSITALELEGLTHYLENPKHETVFEDYVKTNYLANQVMGNYDTNRAKEKLLKKIRGDKRSFYSLKFRSVLKYAAIAILFLGLGYFFKSDVSSSPQIDNRIVLNDNSITLTLDNGSTIVVMENGSSPLLNIRGERIGIQKNGELNYNKANFSLDKFVYHTLKVPYGKKSLLILSDGTVIHLNSGSSIKYPIAFLEGKKRQVFLDGEAYFDVSKNEDWPFIVKSNRVNIRVLGTKFNISSYSDDSNGNTVLVEGSVGLYRKGEHYSLESPFLLEPGHKASWENLDKDIAFEQVNTEIYTGWVQGKIIFNRMRFKDIIKKLERHYNVDIINNNKQLDDEIFTASFDTETITEVLAAFNMNYPINYKKVDNKIVIN